MNPAQIRRLARRLHEDRSRRIETLLVRLTADGRLGDSPYVATQAEIDAEASLADALYAALEGFWGIGFQHNNDDHPDVVAVLARYRRART